MIEIASVRRVARKMRWVPSASDQKSVSDEGMELFEITRMAEKKPVANQDAKVTAQHVDRDHERGGCI